MNTKYLFMGLMVAGLTVLQTYAQDSVINLSLTEAVTATLNNNKNMGLARLDEQIAESNYKQTEAAFLPQAGLSYTAMVTNNPLNAFGFKLQQGIIAQSDFNPAQLNNPLATANYTAKFEVQQPLLNMDMLYMRKGAQQQIAVYKYKTQRTKEYLTLQAQSAYLQLQLAYKAVAVLQDALHTANAVYTFADNHFKQGLIQQSDVLSAQVQVAAVQSRLAQAQSSIANASDVLSDLMGHKPGVIYKAADAQAGLQPEPDNSAVTATRADLMAMQKAIDASDVMIKASQMSYLPKLNAFGNYQYNDNRVAGFGANSYLVGVQLSWDIFKGNRTKNTIITQKLERDKLAQQLAQQKQQADVDVNKARRDWADAVYAAGKQKTAVEQAAEALRILQNRYEQGLVNTTDVLMAATQLSQQKFELAKAEFNSNMAQAYLQFLIPLANK